jgi:hypothetical protein
MSGTWTASRTATAQVSGSACERTAAVQHGWLGWSWRPDTDHARLRRPWPAVALVPGPDSSARRTSCHVAVAAATHAVSTPVAGEREATGYCPGRQSAVDTGMAIDTSLARCAGHQPSGERSLEPPFRKQRTVNPLMVPARYNFLYSSQGRPCGRPPAAAVLAPATTPPLPGTASPSSHRKERSGLNTPPGVASRS